MAGSAEAPATRRVSVRVLDPRSFAELTREIARTDLDPAELGRTARHGRTVAIALRGVPLKAVPLLRQELLRVGGEAAHGRGIADHSASESDVVLLATVGQYRQLLPRLRRLPFGLPGIAQGLEGALRNASVRAPRRFQGAHRAFTIGEGTVVMGVVNVTPDSFSDGGRFMEPASAIAQARQLVAEGATIIDVGGESTRPGAAPISEDEEWRRIRPVLTALAADGKAVLSVDTRHPVVAGWAVEAGADLVNDVGGLADPAMRKVVAESGAGAVLMHMRGTPTTMQRETDYRDLRGEVFNALADAAAAAERDGVKAEKILLDPGLGFAKTALQSLELLSHIGELRSLGYPVVVGASRKSFLGAVGAGDTPADRLEGSLAAAVVAALGGAEVVRTHDVAATVRALSVVDAIRTVGRPRSPAESEDERVAEP